MSDINQKDDDKRNKKVICFSCGQVVFYNEKAGAFYCENCQYAVTSGSGGAEDISFLIPGQGFDS